MTPGAARRVLVAVGIALVVTIAVLGRIGVVAGEPVGAADNADGVRLFCTARLAPDATDGRASGHGIVVDAFRTGGPECRLPAPVTSGGVILRATVALTAGDAFDLSRLATAYAALLGLGAGVAAWAAGRRPGPAVAVVVPPLLPLLVVPWWSRFLVSTYAEPAGLLGAAWCVWGLLVVALTRPVDRSARLAAIGLVAVGGVVAATAKPGFMPVGVAAVAAVALVTVGTGRRWWWRRGPAQVAAALAVGIAASPVLAGIRYQDALYEVPNTHDLVFTAILPESGPAPLPALGLPAAAFRASGEHYYLYEGRDVRGWDETPGPRTLELRSAARRYVAEHPVLLARMVHRGLVITVRPQIPYLVSTTAGDRTVDGSLPVPEVPEAAQRMGVTFAYLDRLPGRPVPPLVLAVALLGAASTVLFPRATRRLGAGRGLLRVAGVLAVGALGTVVLAVLGDGYVELAKHVWLASYLLVVTGTLLIAAVVAAGLAAVRRRARGSGTSEDRTAGSRPTVSDPCAFVEP
ncbi:hypothetical protein [Actinomycetospora chiangmaiensis]|uniref:glycan biosynthesis hexose transferase WsfD n=1 Tax=Actinomycetospora chiangmaiensis TaxID=402650 RepID=UPI0003756352|nr:hypothetical protein [Actinomycetospora chiangmaiensis]